MCRCVKCCAHPRWGWSRWLWFLWLSVSMAMGSHFTAFILRGRGSYLCHAIGHKLQPKKPTRPRSFLHRRDEDVRIRMRIKVRARGTKRHFNRVPVTQWDVTVRISTSSCSLLMSKASFCFIFIMKNLWHCFLAWNVDSSLWSPFLISQCKERVRSHTDTHKHIKAYSDLRAQIPKQQ